MNRPGYDYSAPVSTTYYATNSRPPQYDRGYNPLAPVPVYSPSSHPLSNYADVYEGNNDTTLRAEERHWYIENHKNIQPNYSPNNEIVPQEVKIKKEEEKKTDAQIVRSEANQARRRKENRCSCECWPSSDNNEAQNGGNATTRSLSGVDMVASYGVYGTSQDDDSSGFGHLSSEKNAVYGQTSNASIQGVIVNQQGNSAVVRSTSSTNSPCGKCCVWSSNAQVANSEDYCWIHYCRPALIVLLLLFFLVLLGVSTGFLLTNNYLHYQPRPPAPEEACEKTFCRWGAECVSLGDGRAHCACPTTCTTALAPVCSTAGRTYRNHCLLRKEACERRLNLRVKHEGECETGEPCSAVNCQNGARCVVTYGQAECRCPRNCQRRKVVCGTDGREYPSACHLDKHACENQLNITVKYHGKCDPCIEHECADGSVCQLNEVRMPVCRCGPPCDLVVGSGSAVCGSDYKDYISECALRQESCRTRQQLSIAYRGECASAQHPCESVKCGVREWCTLDVHGVAVCGCGPECEEVMRPVCGADGRTYDNQCLLARAACLDNRDIRIAYMGACGVENPCALASCPWGGACVARGGSAQCSCPVCDPAAAPVCASDLATYGSECKMRMHACQAGLAEHQLKVLYNGTCETCADIVCRGGGTCEVDSESGRPACQCNHNCTDAKESDAICGTDGQTYPSECDLLSKACRDQSALRPAYIGSCALCEGVQCSHGAHCVAGECVCPTDCSGAPHEPVCGSTMETYSNECELQKAACGVLPPAKIHVIFYGDCKDRLAVVPPIAMTTTAMSSTGAEQVAEAAGATEAAPGAACRDIRCDFGASCELGLDGYPRCSCLFQCPSENEYFPVCASDFRLYPSLCAMRKEGCQKQLELRLRPLDLCKGMEVRPCGDNKAMIDVSTGLEIDCGNGPHRQDCPAGSYCHITLTAARCCPKNDAKQGEDKKATHCSESAFGCCADGSAAGAPGEEGCPASSGCGCNRLGSVADRCDGDGQCACRPGVGGLKCDRCEPGYWGLPRIGSGHTGCIPCGCSAFGSVREDCEQMTGRCVCRPGVQGQKCTVCADHRRRLGPNGCSDPETLSIAESCSEVSCYFGAVCTERTGGALCECAAAPCPDSDLNMLVCGSDGKTYESECHLKLQACRTQEDIVIQAFGPCKLSEVPGTAGPPRPSSPIQFTQQDDGAASKSTRHLLNPDKYYNKYDWTRKETPSDFDSILSGQRTKGSQTATTATVGVGGAAGAVGALLGDLCARDAECGALPGAHCARGACVCRPGLVPTVHRKACVEQLSPETTEEYSACLSEPCYNQGTCIDLPGSTFACVCADHYTGINCETILKDESPVTYIETPSFDGSSYIRLKPLKAYHKLNIDIEFKPFSENGVILYNQQKPDGTGDFVSLALVNGYLEFRYNLGNGAIVLTSLEKIRLNEYHKVSAKRYHRDGILSVDNSEDVAGQSRGNLKALDLADDAYIGKVPTNYSRVFDNIGTRSSFIGCIKYLRIIRHQVTKKLGRPDSLIVSIENVRECEASPCVSMPCRNGGSCRAGAAPAEYTCTCALGFHGPNCDERLDPCESNPCGYDEGLLCDIGPDGGHVCRCLFSGEIGSNGNTCKNDVNVDQETWTPQFNGTSYVELMPLEGLGKAFRIEIWFLTNRFSGMLLYTGQSNKAKGDFIAINLVNGYLQFRYNLGSGIANITSPTRVSKGRWHRVRAARWGRRGSLQLDALPAARAASAPPLSHLDLALPLFIGSLPSFIRPHKMSGVTSSFIGAIQQVFVNGIPLSLYGSDTAQCGVVPEEERLPCATKGVTKYAGPPCGDGLTPCKNNGTCIALLNEYKCVCRDGYEGRNCEVQLQVEMLNDEAPISFDGNNYYSYRSRGGRRNRNLRGIRYEIKFRTFNDSGLLLWRRKIGIRPRDFIGLGLNDGKLQLIYTDTDIKEVNAASHEDWFQSIESAARVDDGRWHTATVRRRKRLAMLQVDDTPPVRGYSQSLLVPSKANPKLWIGGSPSLPLGLPAPLYAGLRGCVANIKSNGRHVDITSPIRPMTTIRYCT